MSGINIDRTCDLCGADWRGSIECPVCGYDGTDYDDTPAYVSPVCRGCGNGTVALIQQHDPAGGWLCVPCLNRYDGATDTGDWRAECAAINAEQARRGR